MAKHILKMTIKILFSAIISIVLLNGFVFFYLNTGVHVSDSTGSTDYRWEPYQRIYRMKEGFSFFRMDKNGYNNFITKDKDIDILLMGSSQMEAQNINPKDNVASLLNTWFSDIYTYNIGISGHTIYRCISNMCDAVNTFSPRDMVILVIDEIDLSIDEMEKVITKQAERIPSYDSGLLYRIQKSIPAIKVLYKSIDEWKNIEISIVKDKNTSQCNDIEYRNKLEEMLYMGKQAVERAGCTFVIVYQPETSITEKGIYNSVRDFEARRVFSEVCHALNIRYIDMTSVFEQYYNERHILAHGFANTAVGVGHLNTYGHRAIAEELAKLIKENK